MSLTEKEKALTLYKHLLILQNQSGKYANDVLSALQIRMEAQKRYQVV